MSQDVRNLEPMNLWNAFADLNAVPRPSKKEERVIEFAKQFGESLGLPTVVDEVGNVIIKKPATAGMEDRKTVVLQSHLDMVHQKNNDTVFDFDAEGIRMVVDGDWVKADGTTLGADNGIGVAAIMAIFASDDIPHPPLEALFTIDEETGMTGAMGLKGGMLDASIMLNLDTEDDDELTIGCAGGTDVTAQGSYNQEDVPAGVVSCRLTVRGLTGGHSGMDIHKGRGNANKLLNRILYKGFENFGLRIASINGGGLRNAIPREAVAHFVVSDQSNDNFESFVKKMAAVLKEEYRTTDPDLELALESDTMPTQVMNEEDQDMLLAAIYACPNGIYRLSPDVEGLTQTSNNVACVIVGDGEYSVQCLARSAVNSEKDDISNAISAVFEMMGGVVTLSGSYPGWAPKPDSGIVKLMSDLYTEMFQSNAQVMACHAGLECGILGTHYSDMEMISFGPNIRGAHSPDETVQISSVQKFWKYLLEALSRIPKA